MAPNCRPAWRIQVSMTVSLHGFIGETAGFAKCAALPQATTA